MTMTKPNPEREERRRRQKEIADQLKASGALDEIFAKIDAGEALTGEQGLIGGMLKAALERGLETELTEHVGYERGDAEASLHENSRNGTTPKTVATEIGDVELAIPRDRNGTFTPMLVPKGQRQLDGLDGMIISLYAGGMTLRDIQHHLASTIGTELSHETISKITDQVADEVLAWQQRPLDSLYPVIYLDAIIVKVRDGGHVRNKAAHIAVGVDMDGIKHVLGIWVQATEGAKFWLKVFSELRRHPDCGDRRAGGDDRGARSGLPGHDAADVSGALDASESRVGVLERAQGIGGGVAPGHRGAQCPPRSTAGTGADRPVAHRLSRAAQARVLPFLD